MNVDAEEVPAAQVAAHLQELRKVREEISANMRFTVPAAVNDAQRQQRLRALLNGVIDGEKTP
jgi:molecular chaperone DnaK (HSP70)